MCNDGRERATIIKGKWFFCISCPRMINAIQLAFVYQAMFGWWTPVWGLTHLPLYVVYTKPSLRMNWCSVSLIQRTLLSTALFCSGCKRPADAWLVLHLIYEKWFVWNIRRNTLTMSNQTFTSASFPKVTRQSKVKQYKSFGYSTGHRTCQ